MLHTSPCYSSGYPEVGVRSAGPIPREEPGNHGITVGGHHGRAEAVYREECGTGPETPALPDARRRLQL